MIEFHHKQRILVLAPHTDDAELGMGGTIAKLIEHGKDVYCVAFSACEQSVFPEFPADILITETKIASAKLGVKPENLRLYNYPVRTFGIHRQDILNDMIRLRHEIKPDLVFIPSLTDVHQDHRVISDEGVRAFKFASILCYELPWNNLTFTNSCFSILEPSHVDTKVEAVLQYKSQAHRAYTSADYIRSLARTRGVQINQEFAECFEIIRMTF